MNIKAISLGITFLFMTSLILLRLTAAPKQPEMKTDPWKPLRVLIGKWEGEIKGEAGTGKSKREYSFVLNDHFIQVVNRSSYLPQKKNPKGEQHEDIGIFSYDKGPKKFILRQFHIEGFVNQFEAASISKDGPTMVFVSTTIENIAPGWRARETYQILNDNEFVEVFALAEPNHDFNTYSETHFRRATR